MKLLSDFPGASMSMAASARLRLLLRDVLSRERISHVLETGTYQGLGSTTFVSESFSQENPPQLFVTIEANKVSWQNAKSNLRKFPFVSPLWGKTVATNRALEFLQTDVVLQEHNKYPDIFIDNTDDPLQFYLNEIRGELGGRNEDSDNIIRRIFDRIFSYAGDNLLEKYLLQFREFNPLVVLDSCGGIGYLEFSILKEAMQANSYLVLLDDINHIKHFRSYAHIKNSPHFHLLGVDEQEGWLLAKHSP